MGFKYWFEGLIMIGLFWIIIGVPCAVVAFWGSKMINELGNFPTKAAKIQVSVWWIYLVEIFFLLLLIGYGAFLYNSNVKAA
jgi:hypothetical protein